MRETDEWTETAGFGICQPFIEVAHTPPGGDATETPQQCVTKGESLLAIENVPECIELVLFELMRWTETEPMHVDAFYAWPPTPTSSAKVWRRTRTSPRQERRRRTGDMERTCALVRQQAPDCRRARRRSERRTSGPTLPQATRPSMLTARGHASASAVIPEECCQACRTDELKPHQHVRLRPIYPTYRNPPWHWHLGNCPCSRRGPHRASIDPGNLQQTEQYG